MPLGEGVEGEVSGDGQDLLHFVDFVGRAVNVDFALEFVMCEEGFVEAAGATTFEVLPHQGEGGEHGEALEGEQDVDVGFGLDVVEEFEVFFEQGEIDDVGWGIDDVSREGRRGSDGHFGYVYAGWMDSSRKAV